MITTWQELLAAARETAARKLCDSVPQELISVSLSTRFVEERGGFLSLWTKRRAEQVPAVVALRGWPVLDLACLYEHIAYGGGPVSVDEKYGVIWLDIDGNLHLVHSATSGGPGTPTPLAEDDARRYSGTRSWENSHTDRIGSRTHEYRAASFAPVVGDPYHSLHLALAQLHSG